ncbi:hypothetical protein [Alkalisalibacterium limincola]|uniref:Transmembrane protein n=1 Tax=Alkalisalibacterium limincola TaxID=2699169 RepID=A0A5C8KL83_9GAMM|nr:hypothetical protein [Alkalisalibacterium limincola]TXK60969.1 hypothetical protein FU658_10325 [Alkalisalibacterium limincola]
MNETVELNLAFILFLPWYAILAVVYWVYPRQPRTLLRWGFDVASLTLASLAAVAATQWSVLNADTTFDAIWPQVLATVVSYGAFLGVMTAAFFLRRRFIIKPFLDGLRDTGRSPSATGATP